MFCLWVFWSYLDFNFKCHLSLWWTVRNSNCIDCRCTDVVRFVFTRTSWQRCTTAVAITHKLCVLLCVRNSFCAIKILNWIYYLPCSLLLALCQMFTYCQLLHFSFFKWHFWARKSSLLSVLIKKNTLIYYCSLHLAQLHCGRPGGTCGAHSALHKRCSHLLTGELYFRTIN